MLLVLLVIAVSVLVVAVVFALSFVDVAFGTAQGESVPSAGATRWHPPLVSGKRLANWASGVAEASTARTLRDRRTAVVIHELVGALHEGATLAIDQTWQKSDAKAAVGCPAYFHSMIAVTPPEAIRAADYIRKFHPEQIGYVREQALQNLRLTTGMDHSQYQATAPRCPLMGSDNTCLAYAVRPLRCRGGCDLSDESTAACRTDAKAAQYPTVDASEFKSRGRLVTEGAERGFSHALQSAGLDGELYDLNGALVAALDTPNAAERWVHGDRFFDNCPRYR